MIKKNGHILIVDDNLSILKSLEQLLKYDFEEVKTISSPNTILNLVKSNRFDVILLDMNFKAGINSGNEGLYWMKEILDIDSNAVVILITAYADIELAIKAIKQGAVDFIAKPWDPAKLIATLQSAIQLRKSKMEVKSLQFRNKNLSAEISKSGEEFIGKSEKILKLLELVDRVASTDANVLITGENGTGKELIARRIHNLSNRRANPFIAVDVTALSDTLLESELFGHEKGAFTDAKTDRAGRFEIVSNGTLFLDEIGNISFNQQAKLLSVLETRKFSRIGSNSEIETNFRLISATNKNINELIIQGLFREDLFYRINTIQVEIPPLRERKDDIPLITDYYLKKYGSKYNKPDLQISSTIMEKLIKYNWPGNIRELSHTIERAVILSDQSVINSEIIILNKQESANHENNDSFKLEDVERKLIENVLKLSKGNLTKAAKIMDISRTTLYSKIQKHGL